LMAELARAGRALDFAQGANKDIGDMSTMSIGNRSYTARPFLSIVGLLERR
jgi:hypothetical protein